MLSLKTIRQSHVFSWKASHILQKSFLETSHQVLLGTLWGHDVSPQPRIYCVRVETELLMDSVRKTNCWNRSHPGYWMGAEPEAISRLTVMSLKPGLLTAAAWSLSSKNIKSWLQSETVYVFGVCVCVRAWLRACLCVHQIIYQTCTLYSLWCVTDMYEFQHSLRCEVSNQCRDAVKVQEIILHYELILLQKITMHQWNWFDSMP